LAQAGGADVSQVGAMLDSAEGWVREKL
jgi:hypothetical protein